jgi:hypothetical protein
MQTPDCYYEYVATASFQIPVNSSFTNHSTMNAILIWQRRRTKDEKRWIMATYLHCKAAWTRVTKRCWNKVCVALIRHSILIIFNFPYISQHSRKVIQLFHHSFSRQTRNYSQYTKQNAICITSSTPLLRHERLCVCLSVLGLQQRQFDYFRATDNHNR